MARASYCNDCGSHNPHGATKCQCCGCPTTPPVRQNPVTSAEFANTKLVIFDIDRTILDTSERHRSAVRAGVQPKDFDYTVFKQMPKKAQNKREAFMYREDMLAKDQVMPNAMPLIEHLMKEGYTIAYCTGRAFKHYEKTKDQLESKGFPLFSDPTGKTLLFLRKNSSDSKGPYKAGVIRTLMAQYDVKLVFDDTIEVLQEAAKLGVPGVYPSIDLYWSMISPTRRNGKWWPTPKAHPEKQGGQYVTGTTNIDEAYNALEDPDNEGKLVGETAHMPEVRQPTIDDFRKNPANPSKVSKGKKLYKHMNGKEPAKVTKKTIDIGDVWYQVGEGGCWEIGYRSGKETGSSDQKYIHHFNEETKDGNLPNLYATIPDNGKPMLIITGGTWKIKTDENGVAWIYD